MLKACLLIFILFSLFSGCSKPKIDGTSNETMKSSIEKVRGSLPESKQQEFDEAIQILAYSNLNLENVFSDVDTALNSIKESLAGKTGLEIIEEANKIRVERQAKEKEQAFQEINELGEKKKKVDEARTQLASFKIIRSRFYKRDREYLDPEPVIELTVKNETKFPISRAYFTGTLASPNRTVPWLKNDFNYQISGGLEPLEKATWYLAPNMFSDWGKVAAPKDAILTVNVSQLDGADGKQLFSIKDFDEEDSERLESLKKKYSVQ